ncbi:MAG: AAA family ATPase [Candidatus Kariarchaeaceae archaeon]
MSTQDSVLIIGLTGLPGSGKSSFANVAKERGYSIIVMGDAVRFEVQRRGLKMSRLSVEEVKFSMRDELGSDIIGRLTLDRVKYAVLNGDNRILIDGFRGLDEVELFKEAFPQSKLVAIHAPPEVRWARSISRRRPDDPQSFSECKRKDLVEYRVGIGEVIASSDYLIDRSLQGSRKVASKVYNEIINDIEIHTMAPEKQHLVKV